MPTALVLPTRAAALGDLPALLALYRQLNPEDPVPEDARSKATFEAMLRHPGLTVFIVESDGVVVATCTLSVILNLSRGTQSYGLIENVVTDAAHRGRGFGRAVLNAAVASAWRQDCYKVMLMTGSRKESTLRFYDNSGFTRDKTAFTIRRP